MGIVFMVIAMAAACAQSYPAHKPPVKPIASQGFGGDVSGG